MNYPNEIEEEIDAIRDKLYSTIKDMTGGERVEYIYSRAREIMKKHGIGVNYGSLSSVTKNDAVSSPSGTIAFP